MIIVKRCPVCGSVAGYDPMLMDWVCVNIYCDWNLRFEKGAMEVDLKAIRERAEKATLGPWKVVKGKSFGVQSKNKNIASCFRSENEEFIANARQDIPALLDYIDKLTAKLSTLEYAFNEQMKFGACNNCQGEFIKREDGCCIHEDKEVGCEWYKYCEIKAGASNEP